MTKGYLRNSYLPSESHSRITTAPILNDDGSVPENGADKGLVVFIVGASISQYVSILEQIWDTFWLAFETD